MRKDGNSPDTLSLPDMPKGRKKGFTLVELLVVISILALLLTMLMPSLGRAKQISKGVQCLSQLRQYGTAMIQYLADHSNVIPNTGDTQAETSGQHEGLLMKYIKPSVGLAGKGAANPYFCPLESRSRSFYEYCNTLEEVTFRKFRSSYGCNFFMSGYGDTGARPSTLRMEAVQDSPGNVVYMGDVRLWSEHNAVQDIKWQMGYPMISQKHLKTPLDPRTARHLGKDNYVFLDGHGQAHSELQTELYKPPAAPALEYRGWVNLGS